MTQAMRGVESSSGIRAPSENAQTHSPPTPAPRTDPRRKNNTVAILPKIDNLPGQPAVNFRSTGATQKIPKGTVRERSS